MLKLKKFPKRSRYWYVSGTVAGGEVVRSTKTTDKALAEAYRAKLERELYEAGSLGKARPVTFSEAARAYVRAGGEDRFLQKIVDEIGRMPLSDIRQPVVDELVAKLYPNAKASTINRNLINQIITVVKFAAESEMPGAVRRKISRRKEVKPIIQPASDDHIEKLLPHLPEGLRALITLMTFTGLRTGEALRVQPEDVQDGYALVGRTKNGQPRMVPLPDGWTYPTGGWGYQTTQGVGAALRRASDAAGVPYRDGHELGRHAFAARFLKAGGNIKQLKEAGGWRKLAVVDETYGHLEQSAIHDFMRSLSRRK